MTAREFWYKTFDEYPQSDADRLAVAMMTEYAATINSVASTPKPEFKVDDSFTFSKEQLENLIYKAAQDGSHQVHYSNLHPDIYPPTDIVVWCEKYSRDSMKRFESKLAFTTPPKPEYKVDEWVMNIFGNVCRICDFSKEGNIPKMIEAYGISIIGLSTVNGTNVISRHATPDEVKEHLSKMAVEKGYGEGTIINSLFDNGKLAIMGSYYQYDYKNDAFWIGSSVVYKQAKWAEIVTPEPKKYTKEELLKMIDENFK